MKIFYNLLFSFLLVMTFSNWAFAGHWMLPQIKSKIQNYTDVKNSELSVRIINSDIHVTQMCSRDFPADHYIDVTVPVNEDGSFTIPKTENNQIKTACKEYIIEVQVLRNGKSIDDTYITLPFNNHALEVTLPQKLNTITVYQTPKTEVLVTAENGESVIDWLNRHFFGYKAPQGSDSQGYPLSVIVQVDQKDDKLDPATSYFGLIRTHSWCNISVNAEGNGFITYNSPHNPNTCSAIASGKNILVTIFPALAVALGVHEPSAETFQTLFLHYEYEAKAIERFLTINEIQKDLRQLPLSQATKQDASYSTTLMSSDIYIGMPERPLQGSIFYDVDFPKQLDKAPPAGQQCKVWQESLASGKYKLNCQNSVLSGFFQDDQSKKIYTISNGVCGAGKAIEFDVPVDVEEDCRYQESDKFNPVTARSSIHYKLFYSTQKVLYFKATDTETLDHRFKMPTESILKVSY